MSEDFLDLNDPAHARYLIEKGIESGLLILENNLSELSDEDVLDLACSLFLNVDKMDIKQGFFH